MATKQTDTTALTDQELDQVSGGMYLPGHEGRVRPLAFPLIPLIVLVVVGAGVVWGAGKVNEGTDKVQEAGGGK
jgi:hypothetical protein